jgi:hypothetical protein
MALSAFDDRSQTPSAQEMEATLAASAGLWNQLLDHLATEYPPLDETWVFSGKKWGWALRLKQKKRAIVYLTPCEEHFVAGFALGEKAVRAAHEAQLAQDVLALIDAAPKYAEGRGVRIEVRTGRDVGSVKQIAAVKIAN